MQYKNCAHMYINKKLIPVETILRMQGGYKGEQWRG
jgi:hypothetical protein